MPSAIIILGLGGGSGLRKNLLLTSAKGGVPAVLASWLLQHPVRSEYSHRGLIFFLWVRPRGANISNHAGYAAVIVIKQELIQEFARIYHRSPVINPAISARNEVFDPALPPTAPPYWITYNLFLDLPHISFAAARSDDVRVDMRLIGSMSVDAPDGTHTDHAQVIIDGEVYARPRVTFNDSNIQAGLSFREVNEGAFTFRVVMGAPLPPRLTEIINLDAGRIQIRYLLNEQFGPRPFPMTPPLFGMLVSQLSQMNLAVGNVTSVMLDGALAIGVDVRSTGTFFPYSTTGQPNELTDFTGRSTLATAINPALISRMTGVVRQNFEQQQRLAQTQWEQREREREEARRRGERVRNEERPALINLETLNIEFEASNLRVWGRASTGIIVTSYSLRARPRVQDSQFWVDIYDVQVEQPLGFTILMFGLLLVPFIGPVASGLIALFSESFRMNPARSIPVGVEGSLQTARTQTFTLPGTTFPACNLIVDWVQAGTDGLEGWSRIRPVWGRGVEIAGPTSRLPGISEPVSYQLSVPQGFIHSSDPTLRVRWELYRLDTSQRVMAIDGRASPVVPEFTFYPRSSVLAAIPAFRITCRLYRAFGGETEELFQGSVRLDIVDRLDRTHPYVRWRHGVYTPEVRVLDQGGTRISHLVGYNEILRTSKIHRTAVPGRCRFADHYSRHLIRREEAGPGQAYLEYLDELPFARSELDAHRHEVCDYCFYGGPDKDIPLI